MMIRMHERFTSRAFIALTLSLFAVALGVNIFQVPEGPVDLRGTLSSFGAGSPESINGPVYAIAEHSGSVYIGGNFNFSTGGGGLAQNIARWDGAQWNVVGPIGQWSLNGAVYSLETDGSYLYAGGAFTDAGGTAAADRVARTLDGSSWSALNSGIDNGTVYAIGFNSGGGYIYVGGDFLNAGGVAAADYLGRWDGNNWSAFGATPFTGAVYAIDSLSDSEVYVGGSFDNGGGVAAADKIAKWNGASWAGLSTGLNNTVRAIEAVDSSNIYVGGSFTDAGSVAAADRVAKWNGSAWRALSSGISSGIVQTLLVSGSDVYIGVEANEDVLQIYNGFTISSVFNNNGCATYAVYGIAPQSSGQTNEIYVGGCFTNEGDANGDYAVRWNTIDDVNISSCTDLQNMRLDLNDNYSLTQDIDCSGVANFIPVGSSTPDAPFRGTFDGQEHTISNLTINYSGSGEVALFGATYNATIENVGLINASVEGNSNVGGLIGTMLGSTILQNSFVMGTASGYTAVGLAVGNNGLNTIDEVYAIGSITQGGAATGDIYFGGLAGYSSGTITDSYADVTVHVSAGATAVGGLVGIKSMGTITNSFSVGTVNGASGAGAVGTNSAGTASGLYWGKSSLESLSCYGGAALTCTTITDNDPYFYENANAPLSSWDFSTLWVEYNYATPRFDWAPEPTLWSAPVTGISGVNAMVEMQGSIYIGGSFTDASGNTSADRVAQWNGVSWSGLGSGLNSNAHVLVTDGSNLYAGGDFTSAGGVSNTNSIAKWNGTTWSALGSGISGASSVQSMAITGTGLFVGGSFLNAGGNASADNIALWTGNNWQPLGTGLNSTVISMAIGPDGYLYVGGSFTDAGGVSAADGIAKWDGSSWTALGSGIPGGGISQIAFDDDGLLYVVGTFTNAGGVAAADSLAVWNGSSWSNVDGLTLTAYTITEVIRHGANIVLGGSFNNLDGADNDGIVEWDGTNWISYETGVTSGGVNALLSTDDGVYVAGTFTDQGGVTEADYIALWNEEPPVDATDVDLWEDMIYYVKSITAMIEWNDEIYVGAGTNIGGNVAADYVAKWNDGVWEKVGNSGDFFDVSVFGEHGSTLVAGGALLGVRSFNGTTWSYLCSSCTGANALASDGTNLYIGGNFTNANANTDHDYLLQYNSGVFSHLSAALNGQVRAIVIGPDNAVYVAGDFTNGAGIANADYIMKWNGTSWSALGTGMNNYVESMAFDSSGNLYVGGEFTTAGGVSANHFAKWNGSAWSAVSLGGPDISIFNSIIAHGTDMYIAGAMTSFPSLGQTHYVGKWDGATLEMLGEGVSSTVSAMVSTASGVYMAGSFTNAGDLVSADYLALWAEAPTAASSSSSEQGQVVGAYCGDGIREANEQCDVGSLNVPLAYANLAPDQIDAAAINILKRSGCLETCRWAACNDGIDNDGDGFIDASSPKDGQGNVTNVNNVNVALSDPGCLAGTALLGKQAAPFLAGKNSESNACAIPSPLADFGFSSSASSGTGSSASASSSSVSSQTAGVFNSFFAWMFGDTSTLRGQAVQVSLSGSGWYYVNSSNQTSTQPPAGFTTTTYRCKGQGDRSELDMRCDLNNGLDYCGSDAWLYACRGPVRTLGSTCFTRSDCKDAYDADGVLRGNEELSAPIYCAKSDPAAAAICCTPATTIVLANGSTSSVSSLQRCGVTLAGDAGTADPLLIPSCSGGLGAADRAKPSTCGNTIVEAKEQCDDGNAVDQDACSNICTLGSLQRAFRMIDASPKNQQVTLPEFWTAVDTYQSQLFLAQSALSTDYNTDGIVDAKDAVYLFELFEYYFDCGDGQVDIDDGEQCDDGNAVDGDGCSIFCKAANASSSSSSANSSFMPLGASTSSSSAGSTQSNASTQASSGASGTSANSASSTSNGVNNSSASSDFFASNSSTFSYSSKAPSCGDGIINLAGEECEKGIACVFERESCNTVSCLCTPKVLAVCGDGLLNQQSEQCEVGYACTGKYDTCNAFTCGCEPPPFCGDEIINQDSEECEAGIACPSGQTCNPNTCGCIVPTCGDGIVNQPSEECDLGDFNSNEVGSSCELDCSVGTATPLAYCGDGSINRPDEECEAGVACGGSNEVCNQFSCMCTPSIVPICGDGLLNQANEQCEAGVGCGGKFDTCNAFTCACEPPPICGDGILNQTSEKCEVGVSCPSGQTCNPLSCGCIAPRCGDGTVNQKSEECDDGNTTDDDGCNAVCRTDALWFTVQLSCGNGLLEASEQCDDANTVDGDGCSAFCRTEEGDSPFLSNGVCGDGVVNSAVEECDDGNVVDGDSCSTFCRRTSTVSTETLPATVIELPLTLGNVAQASASAASAASSAGVLGEQADAEHTSAGALPPNVASSGPAAIAIMAAGAAAGLAWQRRRKQAL